MGNEKISGTDSFCEIGEKIHIHKSWCKACGICTAFCPEEALALDEHGYPYIIHPEKCTRCGICESLCPDFAIDLCYDDEGEEVVKTGKGKKKGSE